MNHVVTLVPADRQFTVEQGETILDAALRQHILLPYGCRNGACGACKARILEGEIEPAAEHLTGLTASERNSGWCLCCQALPRSDLKIESREIDKSVDQEIRTLPARVARMERLSHDVMALHLQLPRSERLQFLAGQYIDVLMRDGKRRSFSLANAPHDDEFLELHIRYYEGAVFAGHVFNTMREKDLLRIRGPYGNFYLREPSTRPILCVAGGTGFAPVKAIVEHALHVDVKRPLFLYWGVRSHRDLYMPTLPVEWVRRRPDWRYVPVYSQPLEADHVDAGTERVGMVHEAILQDFDDLSGFEVYAGGPPVMVHAVADACEARGLSAEHIYSDAFEFAPR
jgi:CDP-4-dehydro-6-deoxyglucose reductase